MRRRTTPNRPARSGFTLIEMLVVIAIIAILLSLTAAAVMRAKIKAEEVQNRHNISQLSTAIQGFTSKTGIGYIPSMLVLREDGRYGDNPNNLLAQAELATESYLKKLWPRMITAQKTGAAAPNSRVPLPNNPGQFLDWNGNANYEAGQFFILQGDQCLVFLLGGMQSNGACFGFGTNKQNPTFVQPIYANGSTTEAPFFDFPTSRLKYLPGTPTRSGFFATFLDPYDTPYLYFCSRGGPGGALNVYNSPLNTAAQQFILPGATLASDCPDSGVSPYFEPSTKPYARDSFQIISAGYDQQFGPGGVYDSVQATLNGMLMQPNLTGAYDDLTNFHDKILGSGNQ